MRSGRCNRICNLMRLAFCMRSISTATVSTRSPPKSTPGAPGASTISTSPTFDDTGFRLNINHKGITREHESQKARKSTCECDTDRRLCVVSRWKNENAIRYRKRGDDCRHQPQG